ncbi:heterokaryon incompatibility protein-domain-containing protein [Xylaria arbuscula]|nr:heterokaryon incompatibility protein-domain-containing protein [Xylaria arbuscula]
MSAATAKVPSTAKSAVTYNPGTTEWKLLNGSLAEPGLRARRANAHRPSPGELLRITTGKISSIQLESEHEQQFQYSELGEGEIRILRLYQNKHPDEPLRADLFKRRLEDVAGRYEALSYCWGTQKATHNIHIRDLNATANRQSNARPKTTADMWKTALSAISHIDFKIRKNLHDGLLRLRSKYRDVYLWVDAICIDQSERGKVEKARQLAMMHKIYNSASNICVWLGEGYDGAEVAFGLVRDIMNYRNFDGMVLDPEKQEAWRSLISIMKAPWFSRRWVIQEIALSRDASVHCGGRSIHWDDFADAVSLLMEKIETIRNTFHDEVFDDVETTSACVLIQTLCNVCRKEDQGEDQGRLVSGLLDVETLVSTLLSFQAAFPRDTIYSILSLAKDRPEDVEDWQDLHRQQLEIRQLESLRERTSQELQTQPIGLLPNYKFSPRDLFIAFVTRSIYQSGSLDIICRHWAPALTDDEGGDTLPSWISNLSRSPYGIPGKAQGRQNGENFVAYLPHDQRRQYSASGTSQAYPEMVLDPMLEFQDGGALLEVNVLNIPEFRVPETELSIANHQLGLRKANPETLLSAHAVSDAIPGARQSTVAAGEEPSASDCEANPRPARNSAPTRSRSVSRHSVKADDGANGQTSGVGPRRLSVSQRTISWTQQPKDRTSKVIMKDNGNIIRKSSLNPRSKQTTQPTRKLQKMLGSPEKKQQHRLSGIIRVGGFILGEIVAQSEIMRGGIVPGEWIAMLGWEKDTNNENRVPDTLWRTLVADRMERGGKPPQWYKRACLHGLVDERVSDSQGNIHPVIHSNRSISELTSKYFKRVESVVWNRRMFELKLDKKLHTGESEVIQEEPVEKPEVNDAQFATIGDYETEPPEPKYGLAPQGCKVSDVVCILLGCSVPVVLSKDREQRYKVVGEAYVHGMMDGEAVELAQEFNVPFTTFDLI